MFVRKIDIFAGGLEANLIITKYLTPSNQYFQDQLAWCLSKKPIPTEISFLYFCSDWYLALEIFISILGILAITYVTQVFEYPRWDWNKLVFNGLACFLYFPCTFAPKSIQVRVGYASFLIGITFFCLNFVAHLTMWLMQVNYIHQLNSFEEIIDAGYSLSGDSFAYGKLLNWNRVSNRSCF